MGLAAGLLTSSRGTAVELVDVKFVRPFDVTSGRKLTSIHHLASGMQFLDSTEGQHVVASISRVNVDPTFVPSRESLSDLKANHTKQVSSFQDYYSPLAFIQTVQNARLGEDDTSVLAQISLPYESRHEHDAYYLIHPALLEATFQLLGIMYKSDDELWVPAGISCVVMHHSKSFCCQGREIWTHLLLVDN